MGKGFLKAGSFKGHSDKSGRDYTYYRLFLQDSAGQYWVSDYVFPNWSPADSHGDPVRPDLDFGGSGFDSDNLAVHDLPPLA